MRWAVLASLTLVSFLLLHDETAIAPVLPAIRQQLGFGLSGMGWVVNVYTLPLAVFMLLGGRSGGFPSRVIDRWAGRVHHRPSDSDD